ncbi:MAG: cell envelope integrity protein CreD [Erythrobacter sp.]|uniref:cell envelope integrity protein CreD n=1 Tax=Erythrobacter sp. TaxID=1042 RepID=UPI00261E0521|nr:cell envelope integrity protein CreD [Erythrobacter sp.]MDJ0977901.1 cell envelope integrity protein CreD [Erythrobacter sp.]
MSEERSPAIKLMIVGALGAVLVVPLMMVYWILGDRQHQARVAQNSVTAAWAGPQVVAGPVLVLPYTARTRTTETVDGKPVTRTRERRASLYIAPSQQSLGTELDPEVRTRGSIHRTVVYEAAITGSARFAMPQDLARFGIRPEDLMLDKAIIQMPISDPRGLQTDARLSAGGKALDLRPGLGTNEEGSGVHAFFDWSARGDATVDYAYALRGSSAFSLVPRGEETELSVRSSWPHPSFTGGFLPSEADREIGEDGFSAAWSISNLALGQSLVSAASPGLPQAETPADAPDYRASPQATGDKRATIRLMEPVDLYKQVERSVKYGFLFIGFTFTAFLMFDVVGGARVASAEYLLTGAGLILFFVMLLAFAEIIGFAPAYALASAAIIGLLTSYSAAVLRGWRRATFIGALLTALYAVLFVLLNLEEWSLVIGSLMLFVALASVMYATRRIDWSRVSLKGEDEALAAAPT